MTSNIPARGHVPPAYFCAPPGKMWLWWVPGLENADFLI